MGVGAFGSVGAGILASISNPYWVVWWASVGASYVVLALRRGLPGLGAFFSGHILADLSWNSLLAFLIASGRGFLSVSFYRGVLVVCGLILVILAIYFIYSGFGFLRGKPVEIKEGNFNILLRGGVKFDPSSSLSICGEQARSGL
jgi:hypothetical protein